MDVVWNNLAALGRYIFYVFLESSERGYRQGVRL